MYCILLVCEIRLCCLLSNLLCYFLHGIISLSTFQSEVFLELGALFIQCLLPPSIDDRAQIEFSLFLVALYNWSFNDLKAQDRRTGQMLVLISNIE